MIEITLQGEQLVLDHRRVLAWPRRAALFIADTHFGKSAVFRREGVALPEGSDDADLETIGEALDDHGARSLYILGDFVHGALPANHRFYQRFNAWHSRRDVEIHVVVGNHDVHVDRTSLGAIHWHPRLALDPFELVHDPEESDGGFFLAGHVHPVVRIATRGDALRMPVFWQRADGLVLPSFGAMTGGFRIRPGSAEHVYGAGPGLVVPLP
jgi:DNA ligase-associated metallophosphoesterase